jgi:hypothetical protein
MKKVNIVYWTTTVLFGAFMLSTAIPNIISDPASVEMISKQLGFPEYLIPFLGVAKTLGVIGLFIPGFPRIKEWAYAGLTFDLVGAHYAGIMVGGFDPAMLFSIIIFGVEALSYIYYHKRLNLMAEKKPAERVSPVLQ